MSAPSDAANAPNDSADNGEGGNILDRLFNNTRVNDREQSQSTLKGLRKKAFTLPFSLFNRRKRTSPNEVEDANGGRRRAATDYSKQQREMQEAERRERQQQGQQQPLSPSRQHRLVSSARYPPADWGKPFDGSQPLDSLVDPATVSSSPTTPAATATPRPLQQPMLHAAPREPMPNMPDLSAISSKGKSKGKGRADAPDSPELSRQGSLRSSLHQSARDEGYGRHLGQHKGSLTEARSGASGQVPAPLQLTSPTASVPRPRRPSFTLTAKNGTLIVSDSYNNTTSASINTHASASPQPATTASSPGTKSTPSPPLARTRASTIQGATPILPSQRGIHGTTSAEALAQATGDNHFSLQRVRRTFSDAFKQGKARQQALERIGGGGSAAATGGFRPQLQQTDERSENESRQSKRTDADDGEDASQHVSHLPRIYPPTAVADLGTDTDLDNAPLQRDNEATLVAARVGQTPDKALPWTNAMLSNHHHLTPVGELPESMRLSMMSLQDQPQEDRVLSPTAAQQQQQQRQPLSAGLNVSWDDRSRSQHTVDGTASKENTFRSNDVTAVDPAAPAPDLPSRKSSLSRLKAELVQSFFANARAAEGKEQQKRGGGVDTPFTPVYMSRERHAGGGGGGDKMENDVKRNAGSDAQQQQQQQQQPQHQHSPSNSSVAFSTLGVSPPSHAHSSYQSHFSPTSTQQALYASKQRLIGPLEAQLAALDSQFNSMFHTLEVRRLESQYGELQRRIEEKKRIVSELEEALKNGELTLTEDGPKTATEMSQDRQSDQKFNTGGQHSDNASLLVAPSETQQRDEVDEEDFDEKEQIQGTAAHGGPRLSESYDAQRVEVDFEPVMTTSSISNSGNQTNPRESHSQEAYSSRTASIPIRPPPPPTGSSSLSSILTRDSLPVSTSTSNSRVPSSATFGLGATRRSMEENSAGIPAMTKLTLPLNLVRSPSNASSDATTTRSVIGSAKGVPTSESVKSTKTKMARHVSSLSGDTKGWESSPTLPNAGLGVEA